MFPLTFFRSASLHRAFLAACGAACLSATTAHATTTPFAPIDSTPAGKEKAVVMLIHQGGWAGPDRVKQEKLDAFPGAQLRARGYRTVSIDYAAGKDGLQSVKDAIGAQLVNLAPNVPLCLYGESAGSHWALLAAADLPSVDCVIGLGTPTDFAAWKHDAEASGNVTSRFVMEQTAIRVFGQPGPDTWAWEPAKQAKRIRGDVTLGMESDDVVLPPGQLPAFTSQLPTTTTFRLPVGAGAQTQDRYLHGSTTQAGRDQLVNEIDATVQRAVGAELTHMSAKRTRCKNATIRAEALEPAAFGRAVACLIRKVRAAKRRPTLRYATAHASRSTPRAALVVDVPGRVTAAVVADRLLKTSAGRRALLARSARTITVTAELTGTSRVHVTTR